MLRIAGSAAVFFALAASAAADSYSMKDGRYASGPVTVLSLTAQQTLTAKTKRVVVLSSMLMEMAASAWIAVSLAPTPVTPVPTTKRVTAQGVMAKIAQQGAARALDELFNSEAWRLIVDGIAGGGAGWLRVAAALKPVSDAHSSEELNCAISEALAKNPEAVLRLAADGPFDVQDACAWRGFFSFGEGATKAKLRAFVARRRAAVTGVTTPSLAATRDACLAALTESENQINKGCPTRACGCRGALGAGAYSLVGWAASEALVKGGPSPSEARCSLGDSQS